MEQRRIRVLVRYAAVPERVPGEVRPVLQREPRNADEGACRRAQTPSPLYVEQIERNVEVDAKEEKYAGERQQNRLPVHCGDFAAKRRTE